MARKPIDNPKAEVLAECPVCHEPDAILAVVTVGHYECGFCGSISSNRDIDPATIRNLDGSAIAS